MNRKMNVLIVTLLMIFSAVVIAPDDLSVKASSEEGMVLDYDLIYDVTKNLSNIINDPDIYPLSELAKGRYFGSKGERWAAENIIIPEMEKIGLWGPGLDPALNNSYLDQIKNIDVLPGCEGWILELLGIHNYLDTRYACHLQTLAKSLKFNDTVNNTFYDIDCYIKPRDNNSLRDEEKEPLLTHNFSYKGVNVYINKNSTDFTDFRLAVRYHLGVDDNELTVIPYIKNIDDEDIPYVLGFAWEIKDIQVDMTPENDYIEIDDTWYYLNGTIDETYTNLSQPCYYIRENITSNTFESLYLRWNNSLNYKVKVESRDGQYNAPVTLGIRIGTLNIGQEKYTSLFWHDASEIVYYFNGYDTGETWSSNPSYMVDGNTSNYASTTLNDDVEFCDNNTCPGTDPGVISKVELRAYGYYSGFQGPGSQYDIILRPVFNGTNDGSNHSTRITSSPGWSFWIDITGDLPGGSQWVWSDVDTLGCDVEAEIEGGSCTLYCSKVEVRITYNILPVISNPFPADGSTGIPLTPMLNITVVDGEGDLMDITWYSNSSGSWVAFGTNNSVGNGTYHQTFVNASVNGQWWYWNVSVSDDDGSNESSVFKFYTGNQSKIENNGSTDIKGYLLIQVQFYNGSAWILADDTVNETSTRVINSSEQLGLDTIFNGLVNTSDLLDGFGSGSYRVYACFRDPDGDVLVCDDDSLMEASYGFTVSSS